MSKNEIRTVIIYLHKKEMSAWEYMIKTLVEDPPPYSSIVVLIADYMLGNVNADDDPLSRSPN